MAAISVSCVVGSIVTAGALIVGGGCGEEDDERPSTTTVTTNAPTPTETATGEQEQPAAEAGVGEAEAVSAQKPLEIPDVLEVVLTASGPPDLICDALVTENYLRTAYGAREGCIAAQRPGALAESLGGVKTDAAPDRATATLVPNGGPYDGVEVEVELVRDGDGWRVDSLVADLPAGP